MANTPLFDTHVAQGAKMVDFGGWQMPMNYGSQIEEHHQVRRHAGMFDVSHMTIVDITGKDAQVYLQYLLANDVAKIASVQGKALYSGMLNDDGGVIDDLIVYAMGDWFRTVVNCATREKDLAWMEKQAATYDVALTERPELAMVAVQGPKAIDIAASVVSEAKRTAIQGLKVFVGAEVEGWFIARTGYTGEDGLEIMLPAEEAAAFWLALTDAGVAPCGLGARDTLRLEAGMNLYGNDMDDRVSPLAANMGWTIAWEPKERNFIGRSALEQQKADGTTEKLVGLVMRSKGVLRAGQKVALAEDADASGAITSGTFSPSLGCSIAMARVPRSIGSECWVEMRGKRVKVDVVKPAFVRGGNSLID